MKNRRTFFHVMAAGIVALGMIAVPALADELLGVMTKVDIEGKKITVVEKDTDKEVIVTVTDDTEYVTPKKTGKVDLEKLSKNIEKAKEKGRKGVTAKIEHDKAVASKITVEARKKAAE
jgi:uncharacterized membrane-anchored protein